MADFTVPAPVMRGRLIEPPLGRTEGERCNRQNGDGTVCGGEIKLLPDNSDGRGCSCHINPPCGYCVSTMPECPACGWREEE